MALAQVAAAESAGAIVLVPESDEGGDPAAVAAALGERALRSARPNGFRTVVLVGGDTTAEVLGDAVVSVGGTVAPGVAWSRPWGESGPLRAHEAGRVRDPVDARRPARGSTRVSGSLADGDHDGRRVGRRSRDRVAHCC